MPQARSSKRCLCVTATITAHQFNGSTVLNDYLLPELTGRSVNVVVDSREGPTFGQTIADWYGTLELPANVMWIESGDAQGFFDLLTERLARLK